MSPDKRIGPRHEARPDGSSTTTTTGSNPTHPAVVIAIPPALSLGGDPVRRIRLHHILVRRRRWSRELDRLLSQEVAA